MRNKSSFELLTEITRAEHPLSFLTEGERCYAFAKNDKGFFYVTRSGSTWKVVHVSKRNQKTGKVVWRRYAPDWKVPPTSARLAYFESLLAERKINVRKPRRMYPKDLQVKKLYAWEGKTLYDAVGLNDYTSLREALELTNEICKDFNMKPIKIIYLKQRKNYAIGGFSSGSTIELLDYNKQTILHEVAHIVHGRLCKTITGESHFRHSHHGGVFAAIYAYILFRYGNFKNVVSSMEWEGLDFSHETYRKLFELFPYPRLPLIENVS